MAEQSLIARIILRLQDEASDGIDNARTRVRGIGDEVEKVKKLLIGWLSFEAVKAGAGTIIELSDGYARLSGRVKQAVGTAGDYLSKQKELFDVSQRNNVALDDTTSLYARSAQALKNLANGQELALKLTEAVNLSFKAQASTATEISSTVTQLTQAIATDAVQWEDFGQLADTNLMLVNVAAKNLGYDGIGALKQAMSDGQVSNTQLVNAIVEGFDEIKAAADQMPVGVEASLTALKNKFFKMVGESNNVSEAVRGTRTSIVSAINYVTEHLEGLVSLGVKVGEVLLVAFGARQLKSLVNYVQELLAARAAAAAAAAAADGAAESVTLFSRAIGLINNAFALFVAFEVGKTIGDWAKQFIWVQHTAAGFGEMIAGYVAGMQLLLSNPFKQESWDEYHREMARIKADFADVHAQIEQVNKAPPPMVSLMGDMDKAAAEMVAKIDGALQSAKDKAKSHATEMVKPYDDSAKAIVKYFQDVTKEIDDDLDRQLDAIDSSASSEKQKIAETTQAVIVAENNKSTVIKNAAAELEQVWNNTYGQAIELTRKAGGDIAELERQGATERINNLQRVAEGYRAAIDGMVGEERRLRGEIQATVEYRENLSRSTEDKIRALKRQTMTASAAYADEQKQIDEKYALGQKALAEGNLEQAKKYGEEMMRLSEAHNHTVDESVKRSSQAASQSQQIADAHANYLSALQAKNMQAAIRYKDEELRLAAERDHGIVSANNHSKQSAKDTTRHIIDQTTAAKTAIGNVTKASELLDKTAATKQKAQTEQIKSVKNNADELEAKYRDTYELLNHLTSEFNKKAQLKIGVDAKSATEELGKIEALAKAKELAVTIKTNPINADKALADLKRELETADIKIKPTVAFESAKQKVAENIQSELAKQLKFLESLPVGVDTTNAIGKVKQFKADIDAKLKEPSESTHLVTPDVAAANTAIAELKQNTSSVHTVYVNEVRQHAAGGMVQKLAAGGRVAVDRFRRVVGAVKGPGTGTSDDVPVMASNGEYVVKTDAVQYYGVNFLEALNNKQLPVAPGYAIGGQIGAPAAAASAPQAEGETLRFVFEFPGSGKTVQLQGSRSAARGLAVELRNLARLQ